jgi:uncharacterized alpha-E superfamily protein
VLCRTASDLYWLGRQVERCENTARLIDLTQRISLLPERLDPGKTQVTSWQRALDALGMSEAWADLGAPVEAEPVLRFLMLDGGNSASIRSCLRTARELGRAQRGAITAEMYQELNASWLELADVEPASPINEGLNSYLEWVKTRSAAFRGVTLGTMGRDEGYRFISLGTFIERADNTVRLLDIKYAQASDTEVHEARNFVQYYQWSAMLQAMSAFETYRKSYRDAVDPIHVAEMMIFDEGMPRSLAICCRHVHEILRALAGDPRSECVRLSGALAAGLGFGRMQDVIGQGMQVFLDRFMQDQAALGREIVAEFMTSVDPVMQQPDPGMRDAGSMVS